VVATVAKRKRVEAESGKEHARLLSWFELDAPVFDREIPWAQIYFNGHCEAHIEQAACSMMSFHNSREFPNLNTAGTRSVRLPATNEPPAVMGRTQAVKSNHEIGLALVST
jgi:hypothetical protein